MENTFGEKRVLQLQMEGRAESGPAQALGGTRLPGLLSRSGVNAQVSACTCARCRRVERRENSAEVSGKAVHLNSQAGSGAAAALPLRGRVGLQEAQGLGVVPSTQ